MTAPRRLLAFVLLATVALAHVPWRFVEGEPLVIPAPTPSVFAMGAFVTGEEVFVLEVSLAQRFGAPLELLVPRDDALAEHRPAWALVAPGLPQPSDAERAALPRPLPPGFGAVVELNDVAPRPVLFESVMRRFYWSSRPLAVVLAEGKNEVWLWSPGKTTGKFGLSLGVEEGGNYARIFDDWSFYAY